MLNFHQSLPFLNWLFPLLHFPARFSCNNFPQDFPATISHKIFPQQVPTRFSCNNFPQDFPTRISCKIFPSWILIGWLPITLFPNAKLPLITAFLKLTFSPPPFPTRFSHKNFPQDFPTRFSCKISCKIFLSWILIGWLPITLLPNAKFPQITAFLKLTFSPPPFPTRFSCKIFPQEFPSMISHKIFFQWFAARFSHKNFPQGFPELDPDWLAPITLFQMLNFHQSLPFLNWLFPLLHFPQDFLTRFSHKNFPARFSHKNFPQEFPTRFSCKISRKIFLSWILIGWLPITLFQMLNFHQSLPFLNWLFPLLHFPARFSCNNFPQDFPATISHKIFPQQVPTRFSHKNFLQDFPELDPDWLAPHHPIPNAKLPLITAFLKLTFSPPPFPTRFFHKIFPPEFPTRFCTRFSWTESWLVGFPSPYSKC